MAVFLLIRHGHNDSVGRRITGRMPGIRLNSRGQEQALSLPDRLAGIPLTHVYCSPLERARETAAPLARRFGLEVTVSEELHEVEFGRWAGQSFEELEAEPRWRHFNTFRSGTRIPGGELMVEIQARMIGMVEGLRERHPNGVIAIVSHGDPIKTVIAHYAGFPLDHMLRLEISLASVSVIRIDDWGPRLLCVNSLESLEDLVNA